MIASAPQSSRCLARIGAATTGITKIPAFLKLSMYLPGLPAPVVTNGTFSSHTILTNSSVCGCMSMRFTPNGLSVRDLHVAISCLNTSGFMPPVAMIPRPPALEQAAAKAPVAILAIAP